jgi:SAM-dependent methyltransferase
MAETKRRSRRIYLAAAGRSQALAKEPRDMLPAMVALPSSVEQSPERTLELQGELSPEWREHFLALLGKSPRFASAREFLRTDIASVMRRIVPGEGRVLEVGVGTGHVLGALPNRERHGIDLLVESIEASRRVDPSLTLQVADIDTLPVREAYDSILCDRLIHTVPDVQRLLESVVRHLHTEGRVFLTCFNFYWGIPLDLAARLGLHERAPAGNWFSESTLSNLFMLAGLEIVHYADRVLFPMDVPFANTILPPFPPFRYASLYRTYVLRRMRVERDRNPSVTVVVPARNEAGNIAGAIQRTPAMGRSTELLFVEGGSSDDTWGEIQRSIQRYRGPLHLRALRQTGKGKADAVRLGFREATGDLLMILDADLTVTPEDLPKFFQAMVGGRADYVHGSRLVYRMESEAMRPLNRLGNAFFARAFSFLIDQPVTDSLCGTKVLWKKDYERLVANRAYFGDFDPFGDFDLIFGARKLNLKIVEIPICYRNRVYGETNISRFRDGWILLKMTAFAARRIKFA